MFNRTIRICRPHAAGQVVVLAILLSIAPKLYAQTAAYDGTVVSFGDIEPSIDKYRLQDVTSSCVCGNDNQGHRFGSSFRPFCRCSPIARLLDPERERIFPILGKKAREAGYEIPLPNGVGGNIAYMDQGMDILRISIGVDGAPPEPIQEIAPFRLKSRDTNVSARYDLWLLPFLNVYGIYGRTTGSTVGNIVVSGVPGLEPDTNIPIRADYDGPTYGGGVTLAGGGKKWFGVIDINYTKTDLDGIDNGIWGRNVAPRIGLRGAKSAFWIGGFYLDVDQRLTSTEIVDGSPVVLEIDLDVATNWNFIYGVRWEATKNLEFVLEHGFSGRNQVIGAFSVRF